MTRAEGAARAAELKAQGLNGLQIAERMGIGKSQAYELLSDPDGSARKKQRERYAGACIDCGGRTYAGQLPPPVRCRVCHAKHAAIWPPDAVICCIQEYADERGGIPPSSNGWSAHKRRVGEDAPCANEIIRRFGSWNAAIIAAGYEPHHGGPLGGFDVLTPAQREECARRYAAGESSVAIAATMGCSYATVLRWVRAADVQVRAPFSDSAVAA